jgi:hypothetical protein
MGELSIALIAAGSALAGSALTGWFTIAAGRRQAAAARYAGDEQAQAVIDTVNRTLDEQRVARIQDARRRVYSDFLTAFDNAHVLRGSVIHSSAEQVEATIKLKLHEGLIDLEGPESVRQAVDELQTALANLPTDAPAPPGARERIRPLRQAFLDVARQAIH